MPEASEIEGVVLQAFITGHKSYRKDEVHGFAPARFAELEREGLVARPAPAEAAPADPIPAPRKR